MLKETHPLRPKNPYAHCKIVSEEIIKNWTIADSSRKACCLRYFNPIGAHESGLLGEWPNYSALNLMPTICAVANKQSPVLNVYGSDYNTRDGSGERDFVHICDLSQAHIIAAKKIKTLAPFTTLNIGTGKAITILELANMMIDSSNQNLKPIFKNSLDGDIEKSQANISLAINSFNWNPKKELQEWLKEIFSE